MKKQCIKCKGRFNRIDLWKVGETWLGDQYVCRSCRRSYAPDEKPPKKESRLFGKKKCPVCGEEMEKKDVWKTKKFVKEWICLNCSSLQNELQKPKFREKTGKESEQEQKRTESEKEEESRIYNEFKRKEKERTDQKLKDLLVRQIESGNKFFSYHKFQEALSCYNEALLIEPNNTQALLSKGDTLRMLGKDTEAILYYNKVLEIEPNNEDATLGKETSLFKLGKRNTEEENRGKNRQREDRKKTQEPLRQYGFDPYAVLSLNRNVSAEELKARFRELIKKNNLAGSINMSIQERERKEAIVKDIIKAKDMILKEKGFSN